VGDFVVSVKSQLLLHTNDRLGGTRTVDCGKGTLGFGAACWHITETAFSGIQSEVRKAVKDYLTARPPALYPITISPSYLPDATSGAKYTAYLVPSGGARYPNWSATRLPTWLKQTGNTLTGTPPIGAADATFTVSATDGYRSATRRYTLHVQTAGQTSGTLSIQAGTDQVALPVPINLGARVSIRATGSLQYGYEGAAGCVGYPTTDPDGNRTLNGVPCDLKIDPLTPLPTAPVGALIARMGSTGPWQLVGSNDSITAAHSGTLYFAYNDDFRQDDSGGYTVNYTVT